MTARSKVWQGTSKVSARKEQGCSKYVPSKSLGCRKEPARPKRKSERIIENADVFDFEMSEEDMCVLDALNSDLHMSWGPTDAP